MVLNERTRYKQNMAKIGNATFEGESGKKYRTTVFPFKTVFKAGISGVYVVTRRFEQADGTFAHEWLYIGHSADMQQQFVAHPQTYGFNKYKANALCFIQEADESERKLAFADLWQKYKPLLNE